MTDRQKSFVVPSITRSLTCFLGYVMSFTASGAYDGLSSSFELQPCLKDVSQS